MSGQEIETLKGVVVAHGNTFGADPPGPYLQDDFDTDFHVCIARGCGNEFLKELLCEQLYPRLKLCRQRHSALNGRGFDAWKEHKRVMDAIAERAKKVRRQGNGRSQGVKFHKLRYPTRLGPF